jgi:hypothetical protein
MLASSLDIKLSDEILFGDNRVITLVLITSENIDAY